MSQLSGISHLMRGHEDPISYHCSLLIHILNCKLCYCPQEEIVKHLNFCTQPNPSWETLLESPYEINVVSLAPPKRWVRDRVEEHLDENVKNHGILKWRDPFILSHKPYFVMTLVDAVPLYPAISSELYRCSVVGIASGIASRFSNTTTLVKIVTTESEDGCELIINQLYDEIKKKTRYSKGEFPVTHSIVTFVMKQNVLSLQLSELGN